MQRKIHALAALLLVLLSLSLVATISSAPVALVQGEGEEPEYTWIQKVDKDLLKKMFNGGGSTFSTMVVAEGNLEDVENLISGQCGTVRVTLDSVNIVVADIPEEGIATVAASDLVRKVWLDHEIQMNPEYEVMNLKADLIERILESSEKKTFDEEFKLGDPKVDPTSRLDPEHYSVPPDGMQAIEKSITFQPIEFGAVSPETYFTYQVGALDLWIQGYLGQGTYVALLDGGINAWHPMVADAIVGGHSAVPDEPIWAYLSNDHGTMCGSMAVGRPIVSLMPDSSYLGQAFITWFSEKVIPPGEYPWGTVPEGYIAIAFIGEAPEAYLWVEKVLSYAGTGAISWVLAGMQRMIDMREGLIPEAPYHIDVISMSLGVRMPWSAINDGTDPWSLMVDECVEHGITVVQAAGNSGPGAFTVEQAGCARKNIGVGGYVYARQMKLYYDASYGPGAADYYLNMDDDAEMVWYFASRGPTRDFRTQPCVVAPCAYSLGACWSDSEAGPHWLCWGSGTSFACPRVAGESALLINYYLDKEGEYPTPERVRAAVVVGAEFIAGYEQFEQGGGRWDPAEAAEVITERDVIRRARRILDERRCHDHYWPMRRRTVRFEEGAAEVSASNLDIEHYARFYMYLKDPDMYRITVTDIEEMFPGDNTLYIWVYDPKGDLINIAYAYYSASYDRIYQWSTMGRYGWSVGDTWDSGVYGWNQYWTPLDPGYYEIVVENDYESWEPVNFTMCIEKSEVSMRTSRRREHLYLWNKGVGINLSDPGGLYAYEGSTGRDHGWIEQDEWVTRSFEVPEGTTELIVTLDWVKDYSWSHPSDLDLYLIDPNGVLWVTADPPYEPAGIFGGTVNIPETDYFGDFTAENIVPGTWTALIHGYHIYDRFGCRARGNKDFYNLKVEVRIREVTRPTILYDSAQVPFVWEEPPPPPLFSGDESLAEYTLPFSFPFYDGHTYDTIYIGSNGYITFDGASISYLDIPDGFFEHPTIAAQLEDLVTTVYVFENEDYVTVMWHGHKWGEAQPDRHLMLAQLYDNGDIVLSYADWLTGATAGLSRGDGINYITISPAAMTAFQFTYSATTTTIEIESYTVSTIPHVTVSHGTELFSGDDTYASYTLPFDFPFFGTTYNTIYIGSNGYITLDSGLSSYNPANYFMDRPMIAVMGEDLVSTVYVTETADLVIIQWYGHPYGMDGDRDLMHASLYSDGRISMHYHDWVSPDYWGRDAVAGVSKGDGSTYVTISPSSGTAFLFEPALITVEVTEVDYTVSSVPYFFETVTPPVVSGDDDYGEYELPFDFWFYGNTYRTIYIGTNGYITFEPGITTWNPSGIFLDTAMIAAQGQDLITTAYGIDHGDYVTIIWYGRQYGDVLPDRELMAARLYSNGDIDICIKDWAGPDYWGREAVLGISAGDGMNYLQLPAPPHDEKCYKFTFVEIIPPPIEFEEPHPWLPHGCTCVKYTVTAPGNYIFVAKHNWVEKFLRDGGLYASVYGRFLYQNAEVKIECDIDGDGDIDYDDFIVLASAYGSNEEQPAYDIRADFDSDGDVDYDDFIVLAENYGISI